MRKDMSVVKSLRLVSDCLTDGSESFVRARMSANLGDIARLDGMLGNIKGQNYACQSVKEYLFGIKHKKNEKGPWAIMTFVGAPATGKTYMAECISKAMGLPYLRLDMSNFSDKESYCDLFGLNPSYKSSEPGYLTKYVRENPIAVVTLDEIEKCHPNVMNRLLQVFERGEIEDLCLKERISFSDVIFVLTSNICREIYDGAPGRYNFSGVSQNVIVNAMRTEVNPVTGNRFFSDALVSRITSGRVILFNRLSPEILHEIAVGEIERQEAYYRELYRVKFDLDRNSLAKLIIFNQGERADARSVKKSIAEFFEKNIERLSEYVSEDAGNVFTTIGCALDAGEYTQNAKSLFMSENKYRILVSGGADIDGCIPPEMADRTEIIYADADTDIRSIADLDISAAILDIGGNYKLARDIFTETAGCEAPTYVYDLKKRPASQFLYFTDNGAMDSYSGGAAGFKRWVSGIILGAELSYISHELFRGNKIVSFDTAYRFDRRKKRGSILIRNIDVTTAFAASDSDKFCSDRSIPNVTFDDVICDGEIKKELMLVVEYLKNYKKYARIGYRIPRGFLLDGEPGTGKTMLAKALANAAGLPFIQKNAAEFLRELVGLGAKTVREVFAAARRYAPCILFVDEIDCIASSRMSGTNTAESTKDVVDAFLSEMDGFSTGNDTPVFVIAATNFVTDRGGSALDAAFLRRFDRKIHVDLPKFAQREQYLTREINKFDNEVSKKCITAIAKRSISWSLADLNLVVQNALRAAGGKLTDGVLEEAFSSFTDGYRKNHSDDDVRKTAIHEAGHAAIAAILGMCPTYATIVSRSGYGGYVMYGNEDKGVYTKAELLNRICVSLSGRAAEVVFYGDDGINTGASGDIKNAVSTARSMVCDYGMDELTVFTGFEQKSDSVLNERIGGIIREQAERAKRMVEDNRAVIERLADALVERNSLDDTEIKSIAEVDI